MERQRTLTLPERTQRGYWQFLYKYTSKYTVVDDHSSQNSNRAVKNCYCKGPPKYSYLDKIGSERSTFSLNVRLGS